MFCRILVILLLMHKVFGDVFHLQRSPVRVVEPPIHSASGYTYNEPSLPEIIVNKKLFKNSDTVTVFSSSDGYHYEKPDIAYIPVNSPIESPFSPPQDSEEPFVNVPVAMDELVSIPDNDYIPPNRPSADYLPSNSGKSNENGSVIVSKGVAKQVNTVGYNYDPPSQDHPFTPQSTTPSTGDGYFYSPPDKSFPLTPNQTYLPSSVSAGRGLKDADFFRMTPQSPHRLELNEMKCLPNNGGYFRSVLTVQSFLDSLPIIDVDNQSAKCNLRFKSTQIIINVAQNDFERCGVYSCGQDMCLRLRFPQIRGLKTVGDAILTLQCKAQTRVVAKTHSLRLGVANNKNARSKSAHAHGGTQLPFHTAISLYRNSKDGFNNPLEPGGIVQLGEELLLRAHVRVGDGWNFTRVSDIHMQRTSQNGEIINSAALVKENGCVYPPMRPICPLAPVFEPPLGFRFGFKAFMFQGMKSGDEIVMSVRISGCMDQRDCIVDQHACDRLGRSKRSSPQEPSEISKIAFRVEVPPPFEQKINAQNNRWPLVGVTVGGILILISSIAIISISRKRYLREA